MQLFPLSIFENDISEKFDFWEINAISLSHNSAMEAQSPRASGPRTAAPSTPRTATSSSRRTTATTASSSRASSLRMLATTRPSSPTEPEIRRSHRSWLFTVSTSVVVVVVVLLLLLSLLLLWKKYYGSMFNVCIELLEIIIQQMQNEVRIEPMITFFRILIFLKSDKIL